MTVTDLFLWMLNFLFVFAVPIVHLWLMIRSVVYHAMCLYIPKTRLRSRQDPQWFGPSIPQ